MLNKTKTYTLGEFLEKSRYNEVNKLEKFLLIAKNNKKLNAAIIIFTANIFYIQKQLDNATVYAASDPLAKLDTLGIRFLGIVQHFGYYICMIMCVVDIIKSLMNGDTKGAGKIFMRYLIAFMALYGVKFAFDQVKFVFAQ